MQNEAPTAQTLAHYAANPEALANMTDAQLDALANAPVAEVPAVIPGESTSSDTPAVADQSTKDAAAATPATAPATEGTPEGIASRDGKHIIPFWRLADAEAKAKEAADRVKELEAQLASGTAATSQADAPALLSEEELADIERDLPAIGKMLRASQAQISTLSKTVGDLNARKTAEDQDEATVIAGQISEAIAATPKLAHLQATNPQGWTRAVEIDGMLRGKPEWQDKPFAERFAQVVKGYESLYGAIDAPAAAASPQDTQAAIQAKADAALASAAKGGAVPKSTSDIPGGAIPPVDEAAAMLEKSGPQLTAEFMAMTPEQIEAKLNRLR